MAANKRTKALGSTQKTYAKEAAGRHGNYGSGSYGPKTTDPKMVGKIDMGNVTQSTGWGGGIANVFTGAKGSKAYKSGARNSPSSVAANYSLRTVKSGGFNSKSKKKK